MSDGPPEWGSSSCLKVAVGRVWIQGAMDDFKDQQLGQPRATVHSSCARGPENPVAREGDPRQSSHAP